MLGMTAAAAETLTGTADGFNGPVSVAVEVEGGKIIKVEVTEQSETPAIAGAALEAIPAAIVEKGDAQVDIVSGATFPTYFLKKDDPVARIQMELDVTLFASQIAPFFGITQRFVGTEPNCKLTDGYNETMQRILPVYGIEFIVVERKQAATGVISASRVRELLAHDDLAQLSDYVPATTLAYLSSDEAEPIRQQLRHGIAKTSS